MPSSSRLCKRESVDYIVNNFKRSSSILDVGAGEGTYYNLLSTYGFNDIDAVEIFEPYIEKYKLNDKYCSVFLVDVMAFDFFIYRYDIIILGDILEHLSVKDSQKLINNIIRAEPKLILISVPYNNIQGTVNNNVHETHLQPDLTKEIFEQRYPQFKCLCEDKDKYEHIGVWVYSPITI